MEQFYQASILLQEQEDKPLQIELNNGIGQVHFALKNYTLAHQYFNKSTEIATTSKDLKERQLH